jgi:uncharacterized protein YqcC (DUF446 family)
MVIRPVRFAIILFIWIGVTVFYLYVGFPFWLTVPIGIAGWWITEQLFLGMVRPTAMFKRQPLKYEVVASKLDQIEAELKRIGWWQDQPLQPEQYQFQRAFAGDTMAYPQWLQFVFIPNVRQIIANKGSFPASSSVGAYAVREFDGLDAGNLLVLLHEFDRLF